MPMVWCVGSIVGPMIGGALAKPVDSLPSLFSPGSIWERFPYAEKKCRRDPGLEFGSSLLARLPGAGWAKPSESKGKALDEQPLLSGSEEHLPGYRTNGRSREPLHLEESGQATKSEKPGTTSIFNKTSILIIVTYGILAFHTMTFDALLPVFLSTNPPEHRIPTSLPFRFADGFGYDTKTIGIILSAQGFYSITCTYFLFPMIAKKLGSLRLFRLISVSYPLLYLVTPYLVLLPQSLRMAGIYGIVVWKCTFSTLAYPSNAILLTNSAPSTLSLGTINGAAASTASLSRAAGPAVSGLLYTVGLESGYSGLVWWATGLVTIIGAWLSFRIDEPRGRLDEKEDTDSELPAPESRDSLDSLDTSPQPTGRA